MLPALCVAVGGAHRRRHGRGIDQRVERRRRDVGRVRADEGEVEEPGPVVPDRQPVAGAVGEEKVISSSTGMAIGARVGASPGRTRAGSGR